MNDAARIVGNTAVVAHGEFELAPGDNFAVLRNVKLERRCELPTDGVEPGPRQREADAHLEDIFGACAAGAEAYSGASRHSLEHGSAQDHGSPESFYFY